MFFQTINRMITTGTDLSINIRQVNDKLTVAVMPRRAGLAVLIIRAADLSYIGRGTMGREKRRLPPPGDVTLF